MIIFVIFVVALLIIFAGALLSPRFPFFSLPKSSPSIPIQHTRRMVPARAPYGTTLHPRVGENRRARVRRSALETDRRAWSYIRDSLNIGQLFGRPSGQTTPWLGIFLILLSLFVFGTLTMRTILPNPYIVFSPPSTITTASSTSSKSASPPQISANASKNLIRIGQLNPDQYASQQDYTTWAYSTCSAAAMTEVINAYGHHYRIADILKVEAGLGEITPDQGLLRPQGIDRTVAHFGFQAVWLNNPSLDDIINIANHGKPVIANFPPSRWPGGHFLVVTGGNSGYVYTADSSRLNMQAFTHQNFLKYWAGLSTLVTPKG